MNALPDLPPHEPEHHAADDVDNIVYEWPELSDEDIRWSIIADQTNNDLEPFEHYLKLIEGFLEAVRQEHRQTTREAIARDKQLAEVFPPSEEDHAILSMEMLYSEFYFPSILRGSLFVSLLSFLESRLNSECHIRKTDSVPLKLSDIRVEGIERSRIYLIKVLRVAFPSDSLEWQEINRYVRLRNCLVHAEGNLRNIRNPQDMAALREYIAHNPNLAVSKTDDISLQKGFCEEVIQTIKRFLYLLRTAEQIGQTHLNLDAYTVRRP